MIPLVIACDHGGFALKESLKSQLQSAGLEFEDLGCYDENRVDYPDYAAKVAKMIQSGKAKLGLLVCGTGLGVSMAANKFRGIRAAVVSDVFSAKMAREHNDASILCLGGRVVGPGLAWEILNTFLKAEFAGGRHQNRVDKITKIEEEEK